MKGRPNKNPVKTVKKKTLNKAKKKQISQTEKTRRVTLCGLLTAIMLILGYVESLVSISLFVPGIKLGLSNSVLIFAIYMMDVPTAFLLMIVKVTLSAVMFGAGLFSMPMWFALAGGTLSLIMMSLLSRDRDLVPTVVSMAGGVGHNVGQVAMCMLTVTRVNMLFYMGVLMFVGMLTGGLTGISAELVLRHMRVFSYKPAKKSQYEDTLTAANSKKKISAISVVSLFVSLIAISLFALVLATSIKAFIPLWVIVTIISMIMPLSAKMIRLRNGQVGKSMEVLALIIGGISFYCIIFVTTSISVYVGYLGLIISGLLYKYV